MECSTFARAHFIELIKNNWVFVKDFQKQFSVIFRLYIWWFRLFDCFCNDFHCKLPSPVHRIRQYEFTFFRIRFLNYSTINYYSYFMHFCLLSNFRSGQIIHRDLAARNVLITDDHTCKVADFGFARDVITSKIYERKSEGKLPIR